ncbi:phospholipid carrier-dependent glycosyltransferase [Trichocoleus sp. FACHB-90]|uniref:dolichyl-phosphate-mannose--protein mannosyltransferase n=1 Tax=Cyanophyceae TaxID=3028117 RepID=UPI0016821FBB|nr:phospholipid carrier-dependent glycosyltransferase [Trichocoleus sp. FACHB-90]MBD1926684.1 phospholipid carrier-dependent glycosyltransferase [Trichocoleus sp. FACHB-90]
MSSSNKFSIRHHWFWLGMTGVFLVSVALRFWGLERFNTLVFDEVYYAKFANNYLTQTRFFDGHPPLSKYIIAVGMWVGDRFFRSDEMNGLSGSLRSPWSYRWLNALTGSFIPLVVGAIAYQLSYRRSYALIAAIFAAADGLFLVESRYALNNVYLVIFGLVGQYFFLLALANQSARRWLTLALAGIFFGASVAIKWNGLWFLLGVYFIWGFAWILQIVNDKLFKNKTKDKPSIIPNNLSPLIPKIPLQNLTQLNLIHISINLAIIPFLFYSVIWIPHLKLNPEFGFWEVQKKILTYHEGVGDGPKVHPYCSRWYTWLLMLRPVAYFYQTAQNTAETVPNLPPLPVGTAKVIYDVHAMGNPILWWLSTAAIFLLLLLVTQRFLTKKSWKYTPSASTWIALYLVFNWLANVLPWVRVTRCTFLYHYMGACVFAALALAWIVDRWLFSPTPEFRAIAITIIVAILLAFIFWMPIYLGLPLSPEAYNWRMPRFNSKYVPFWLRQWLPNWV